MTSAVDELRAAEERIRMGDRRIDLALRGPLAVLLTEVADSVEQDNGLIQDSTSEATLTLARAINGGQP